MPRASTYLAATRHPWACLLFVLPLLVAYEWGVVLTGLDQPELLRNGADVWVRQALASLGLRDLLWAPVCVVVVLLVWSLRQRPPWPGDIVGVWIGMAVESALFAAVLWGAASWLVPLLSRLAVALPQRRAARAIL